MKLIALLLSLTTPSFAENIYEYHLLSVKELRVKVAVVDTGINKTKEMEPYLCVGTHYDVTGTGIKDTHGHGTNIAGIIASKINPKTTCILVVKYFFESGNKHNFDNEMNALELVLKEENVKFVNFSSGGPSKHWKEKELIEKIIGKGIYFITSSGNSGVDLLRDCIYYPACYQFLSKYFRVVANGTGPNKRNPLSNYGGPVTDWRNGLNRTGFGITMSGTSQSAAELTADLASKQ
jgi:subtilisin family serine protease